MPPLDPTEQIDRIELVFVDVETTGLYPLFGDRIVELGALKVSGDREIDSFSELIDPQRPISPGAMAVNRITNEMVLGKPTFAELAERFSAFIENVILVAHNAPFDLGFLSAELRTAGLGVPANPIIDTLQIARRYGKFRSNSLSFLARHFGLATPEAHRALGDCQTTFQVFRRLTADVFKDGPPTVGVFLDRLSGWSVEGEQAEPLNLLPPGLRDPVKRREPLRIEYVDADGRKTTRTIRPKAVAAEHDYIYLVAYCYAKRAERTFRLDRITSWEIAPEPGEN